MAARGYVDVPARAWREIERDPALRVGLGGKPRFARTVAPFAQLDAGRGHDDYGAALRAARACVRSS